MNLEPVIPFEPIFSETIPAGKEWIFQTKWDGTRLLAYCEKNELRLFNRKRNERTNIFPELFSLKKQIEAESFILDGEVIAFDTKGKPSFHEVMRRDRIKHLERVDFAREQVPVVYLLFDLIYLNGEWLTDRSFEERYDRLSTIASPNDHIRITPVYSDGKDLFETIRGLDLEGVVAKKRSSHYHLNQKHSDWRKIKNYKDLYAVIGGVTYRAGAINAILLGLYDQSGNIHYIGHAGSGKLTQKEWKELTGFLQSLQISEKPFINEAVQRKNVQWVKPLLTTKVQYIEWSEHRSLRQPTLQAIVDVPIEQCRLEQVERSVE